MTDPTQTSPPMMTLTGETPTHRFYQTKLDGQVIQLIQDKATSELCFDLESVAQALGYPDAASLLADPIAKNALEEQIQESGENGIRQLDQPGNPVPINFNPTSR
jgi:hypothetical protein